MPQLHVSPETRRGHKIGLAAGCLHFSAALYVLIGLVFFALYLDAGGSRSIFAVIMLAFCLALAAGIELVVSALHRRQFWAWIAGLCIFGMYLPSLFFPLGALGLWGLLDAGSRAEFGMGGG